MEWKQKCEEAMRRNDELVLEVTRLRGEIDALTSGSKKTTVAPPAGNSHPRSYTAPESLDNERLYQAFKARLIEEAPGIAISLSKSVPEIEVTEVREKFVMDTTTPEGRVAFLIADGFFNANRINAEVVKELAERGWPTLAPNVGRAFTSLTEKGFLLSKEKGRYRAVEGMKVNIVPAGGPA